MVVRFLVIVVIDNGLDRVLRVLVVFFNDKLLPDSGDLVKEASRLLNRVLLLEKLAHIVITAAQVNALRAVLLALQVDALRELLQGLLMCLLFFLRQEEATERFVEASVKLFEFGRSYE